MKSGVKQAQLRLINESIQKTGSTGASLSSIASTQDSVSTTASTPFSTTRRLSMMSATKAGSSSGSITQSSPGVGGLPQPTRNYSSSEVGVALGRFHPSTYMPLLLEEPASSSSNHTTSNKKTIELYSEKELVTYMNKVSSGLASSGDWQAKMAALALLQAIALGDGIEYATFFTNQIRNVHEQV